MSISNLSTIFTRGLQSSLPTTPIGNGVFRFTLDEGKLYLDNNTTRKQISGIITDMTESQIRSSATLENKLYVSSDSNKLFIYNGTSIIEITANLVLNTQIDPNDGSELLWFGNNDGTIYYNDSLNYNPDDQSYSFGCVKIQNLDEETAFDFGDEDSPEPSPFTGNYDFGSLDDGTDPDTDAHGDYDFNLDSGEPDAEGGSLDIDRNRFDFFAI